MTRTITRSAVLSSLLIVLSLLLLPGTATAAEPQPEAEAAFVEAINASRAEEGLAALLVNTELAGIAAAWSSELAAAGRLSHNPHYSAQYSGDWRRMGENVGYSTRPGSTLSIVPHLHQMFLDSSGHRANIMGAYNQVGVGVVVADGTLWVTVNFLDGPVVEPVQAEVAPEGPAAAPTPALRNHFVRR